MVHPPATGENLPLDKAAGDSVFCGTVNRFGDIDIRATRAGEDSSLSKLIRMMREAGEGKAPAQRIADRRANWLVPVAVMVVFCPCALVHNAGSCFVVLLAALLCDRKYKPQRPGKRSPLYRRFPAKTCGLRRIAQPRSAAVRGSRTSPIRPREPLRLPGA